MAELAGFSLLERKFDWQDGTEENKAEQTISIYKKPGQILLA